jgi:hypothetical protein
MDESWNEGPQVVMNLTLPEPLYARIEYAAAQKGVTVSAHVREWVIQSLAPWDYDEPLPTVSDVPAAGPHERQTTRQPKDLPRPHQARRAHPELSLRAFSQWLYDQDIYQSRGWGPYPGKPVNSATLSVWLRHARDAGLLPKKAMPTRAPKVKTVAYPTKASC